MKVLRLVWSRLTGSLAGTRREAELADEFQSHIEMLTEDNLLRGLSPAEARRAALLTFGGVAAAKESYRERRGLPGLDVLRQDARYAFRGMKRSPVFTTVAVACLALGIGANTAIFSLFNAVMIRPLPVAHPEQLVFFRHSPDRGDLSAVRRTSSGYGQFSLPFATYEAFRDHARTLAGVFVSVSAGSEDQGLTVAVDGSPFTADGEMVTGEYFSVLGVPPVRGRAILASDLATGAPGVAVISHAFWLRRFDGQSSAVGRTIMVNGAPFTVVGVAPAGFTGLNATVPDLWFPLRPGPAVKPWGSRNASGEAVLADRKWWWCGVGGRLKPGVTQAQVLAETEYLFRQSITAGVSRIPENLPELLLSGASPVFESVRRKLAAPLGLLLATATLVLLIACVNLATLLLARAKARQKEIGVRLAIGASRGRIVRQLLTESVLLSASGGVLGLLAAGPGAAALLRLIAGSRLATPLNVTPDSTVLAFAVAATLGTGVLFGLAPAFRAARTGLARQLSEGAVNSTPRRSLTKVLIAAQISLSVVLLFTAGLLVRTFRNLDRQELGFDRDNLLLFEVDPERSGYKGEPGIALHNQLAGRIREVPGVQSVSYSQVALLSGAHNSTPTATDGTFRPAPQANEDYYNRVGPGFFETMGMRLLLGRGIEERDAGAAHPAAVVNEAWARHYFPNDNPVGHRLTPGAEEFDPEKSYEIVGVAADAKYNRMRDTPPRTVYLSPGAKWDRSRRMCFAVRTAAPIALLPAMQEAVRAVDPSLPLFGVRTQREQIEEALGAERLLAHISSFFGILALLLVAIGVYGTLAYAVARRTGEIGIRMALGASRAEVVWMVQGESLAVAAAGLAVGLPAALALSRVARGLLFGVSPHDGLTLAGTVVLVFGIAAVAGFLPARRASRIDPIRALRSE